MRYAGIFSLLFFSISLTVGCGSAIAEDIEIVTDLYPEGASDTGNPVTLSMKGKTYPGDASFDEILLSGKVTPDEKLVMDAVTINTHGTLSDVRKLWTADEQDTPFFSDSSVFARSQSFFRRITGAAFLAKILYGNYLIFLVQVDVEGHRSMVIEFPVKKQNGIFYLTNELGSDPVFIYFLEKYKKSLSFKTPTRAEGAPMRLEFYPRKGSKTGSPVTVQLKGKYYPKNAWFDEMAAKGVAEPDERFIIEAFSVQKSGTVENLVALWAPAERNGVSERYSDPKHHALNQGNFRAITNSAFLAKILYGPYEIFIVQHDVKRAHSEAKLYTVKKIEDKYYLSNDLEDDPVWEYLKYKYAASIPKKKR